MTNYKCLGLSHSEIPAFGFEKNFCDVGHDMFRIAVIIDVHTSTTLTDGHNVSDIVRSKGWCKIEQLGRPRSSNLSQVQWLTLLVAGNGGVCLRVGELHIRMRKLIHEEGYIDTKSDAGRKLRKLANQGVKPANLPTYGGFHRGSPIAGWFVMEHPNLKWMI